MKRNSFKKAWKQVVTTKLFMNVLLQFRNENLQISVSEIYLAGTITQFKISFKQNWPQMFFYSGHLLIVSIISTVVSMYLYSYEGY